jgi:hypothetical protein
LGSGITIPMPPGIPDVDFKESGTLDLGSMYLGITLGNLNLPGLSNLSPQNLPPNAPPQVAGNPARKAEETCARNRALV